MTALYLNRAIFTYAGYAAFFETRQAVILNVFYKAV